MQACIYAPDRPVTLQRLTAIWVFNALEWLEGKHADRDEKHLSGNSTFRTAIKSTKCQTGCGMAVRDFLALSDMALLPYDPPSLTRASLASNS
eukprot:2703878-Amphidinium_carterae.1